MKTSIRPKLSALVLGMNFLGLGLVSGQLTWDADGPAGANPSDGGGAWLDEDLWWDGVNHTSWDNGSNAGTLAIIGSGGTSGIITFGSGVNAGGLRFDPVATSKGYLLGAGTLDLGSGATIDIRNGASNAGAGDRVRFSSTSVMAGSDITISNAVEGSNFASYATFSGTNTWTGTLTLTGNGTGLFVDTPTSLALNTLSVIDIGSTATLALNNSATDYTAPTIRIGGEGLGGRGSLRFDNGTVTLNSNIVLTSNGRISTNASGVGVINGVISGGFNLGVNSGTDAVNRIVLKNTNTFDQLTVNRGNVQIGENGVGTSGLGVVNLNGSASSPATISGSGSTRSGLFVSGGTISPGDDGGAMVGTLTIGANLNFTGLSTPQTAATFTLAAGGASDRINVTNNLLLDGDGNLSVLFDGSYTPTEGDSWTLITWGGALTQNDFSIGENLRTGADGDNNEGNLDLADLSSFGYAWDIALENGALTATIVVPEPSHAVLGALGLLGSFGFRRRR